jgi:hypothetical protein
MRITASVLSALLLIVLTGCSAFVNSEPDYEIDSSTAKIWKDDAGQTYIVLAVEVSNTTTQSVYFKESKFDIVDETGALLDTMEGVQAYPSVALGGRKSVYYDALLSDKVGKSKNLKAIPHIEAESTNTTRSADLIPIDSFVGGSQYSTGTIHNISNRKEYHNVRVAEITRDVDDNVVSVMTAVIERIKPQEKVSYRAVDRLSQREKPAVSITTYENFVYLDP